jgi:hypothetical protein
LWWLKQWIFFRYCQKGLWEIQNIFFVLYFIYYYYTATASLWVCFECIGCSFKFLSWRWRVDCERAKEYGSRISLNVRCLQIDEWYVHNRLFNANCEKKWNDQLFLRVALRVRFLSIKSKTFEAYLSLFNNSAFKLTQS